MLSYGNILVHDYSVQMLHVDNSEPVDVTPLASFTVKLKDIQKTLLQVNQPISCHWAMLCSICQLTPGLATVVM